MCARHYPLKSSASPRWLEFKRLNQSQIEPGEPCFGLLFVYVCCCAGRSMEEAKIPEHGGTSQE